ncbi:MAG: alkylmercury lyase [Spirochaetaceae bacterium]|nr:MAG: alkylmercury lyase [Spirochaetaceae bacterium]
MIEFQYFDGCPNAQATLENLNELIEEGLIDRGLLTITELSDLAAAERVHFQGSPTILVDGVDIYTGKRPTTMNYTCRIFDFDGLKTGVIGKEFIRKRIRDLGLTE